MAKPAQAKPVPKAKNRTATPAETPEAIARRERRTRWSAWKDRPDDAAISELCEAIIQGGHLAGFCEKLTFAYVTVLDWINADRRRTELYMRAREDRGDLWADETQRIADEDCTAPVLDRDGNQVGVAVDSAAVQRNKLRVETRKWLAAKMKPRVYGDKLAVGGADDMPPIKTDSTVTLTADTGRCCSQCSSWHWSDA